jgi:hypothetical protein
LIFGNDLLLLLIDVAIAVGFVGILDTISFGFGDCSFVKLFNVSNGFSVVTSPINLSPLKLPDNRS